MLWFNFILSFNFIFLCSKLINVHNHKTKQRKIKFKLRIKLNHNMYMYHYKGSTLKIQYKCREGMIAGYFVTG